MAREISSTSIVSDNHFFCAAASTWHSRGNSIFAVWCKSLPCRGGVSVADGGVTDPSTPLRLRNASLRVAQDDSGRSFPPHPSRLCRATFPSRGRLGGGVTALRFCAGLPGQRTIPYLQIAEHRSIG